MESPFVLGSRTLVNLTDAAKLVPYSRDYIARLAREAKIAAAQIDRQWFIDRESLRNFYEHTQLEVKARAEYTRTLRRQELEAVERRRRYEDWRETREQTRVSRSAQKTIVVIVLGLWVGFLLQMITPMLSVPQQIEVQSAAAVEAPGSWYQTGVVSVSTSSLSVEQGVLLLPASTSTTTPDVASLFSDPVLVTESATNTRGTITTPSGDVIPFVHVPSIVVSTTTE